MFCLLLYETLQNIIFFRIPVTNRLPHGPTVPHKEREAEARPQDHDRLLGQGRDDEDRLALGRKHLREGINLSGF